jgi:hypothetical protein
MVFRPDNRAWLRDAIETRRPEWVPSARHWLIPNSAAQRVFDKATADGRSATITRTYKPKTVLCTTPCQTASPHTVHTCTCICGGQTHGQASGGWTSVGGNLLVRPGSEGLIVQTVSNRV